MGANVATAHRVWHTTIMAACKGAEPPRQAVTFNQDQKLMADS